MSRTRIRIDSLVLNGVQPGQERQAVEAFRRELSGALARGATVTAPASPRQAGASTKVSVVHRATATQIGRALARTFTRGRGQGSGQ